VMWAGSTLQLVDGTYSGEGNRDLDFHGESVILKSLSGDPRCCVIDCEGSEESPHRGFYFHSGESPSAFVQGLTVTGGFVVGGENGGRGGAILCQNSSPSFINCIFETNWSDWSGGALHADASSSPVFQRCAFAENTAARYGGAAHLAGGSPALRDCSFEGNRTLWGSGGGAYCTQTSPEFTFCTFAANLSPVGGGACCDATDALFQNCTFVENGADLGAGLACVQAEVLVENSIIAFSSVGAAVHCEDDYCVSLDCSDLFGNAGGDWVGAVAWMANLFGNFSLDPLFCGESNPSHPYSIDGDSPCAPDGSAECGLVGSCWVGCGNLADVESSRNRTTSIRLVSAAPNPFAGRIDFDLAVRMQCPVSTAILDVAGRTIRVLSDGQLLPQGTHSFTWGGRDEYGVPVAGGVYLFRALSARNSVSQRVVRIR